jgi:RNA polymerase sigma-70 factor (ECF subfamily)
MPVPEFTQALTKNAEYLKPVAITLTHDPQDASDLLQETLFRALAHSDKYSIGTNIKAWLYIIMRNVFINDFRKRVKRNVIPDHSAEDLLYNSPQTATANTAISTIRIKEIQTAIAKLPGILKAPFVLYFEGFKYKEISNMLNEPMGTIKSRIHFARKLLRAQVERF